MDNTAFIALAENAALLLAMVVVFDLVMSRRQVTGRLPGRLLAGLVIGVISIGLVRASFHIEAGIVFDTRSVLLSISGLFFGAIPTLVAMVMAVAFRLWQGGTGAWTGILVIFATSGIGIGWRHYRRGRLEAITARELYAFGLIVHLVMLALMLTFPWETAQRVLAGIGLPVILIYPATTTALGLILAQRLRREAAVTALAESEAAARALLNAPTDVVALLDTEGTLLDFNETMAHRFQRPRQELIGACVWDLFPPEVAESRKARISEVIRSGQPARFEDQRGGRWLDNVVYPIRDAGGHIGRVAVIARDITEQKQAQAALRESESRVRHELESILSADSDLSGLRLTDVFDVAAIQTLMDDFYKLAGIGIAIVDLQGRILVATGWQDICTQFHRVHPEAGQYCIESDLELSSGVAPGEHKLYKCKNHMWDIATPIIVAGQHVGNLFLGQFLFDDEAADREFFREQARNYCFDEAAYLAALDRVPRWSREKVDQAMVFYTRLAEMISTLGHRNIRLARALTANKRLLANLRKNQDLLESTQRLAHVGGWEWDVAQHTMTWTDETYRIHGLTPGDLDPGSPDHIEKSLTCYDPAGRPVIEAAFRRCAEEGRPYDLELPLTRIDDGRRIWVRTMAHALKEEGQVRKVIGNIVDITDRRRAEEERGHLMAQIRRQAQQMEQVLSTVPVGVLQFDSKGRVLHANPVAARDLAALACAQVGQPLPHLGDRPLAELLTPPPTGGLWHEVKAAERVFEVLARPVENGAEAKQWVMVLNDVTQERETRTQLAQQERLAAVGQLAAGIAHDLNNNLAVIALYTQMALRETAMPPKTHDRLQTVSQQVKRMAALIQQILDFSRRAMLERRPLNLVPFMKEVVKLLARTIPEHIEVRLTVSSNSEELTAYADPTRMQQIIMNLAVNARDAMPEGGSLDIELERVTVERNRSPLQPEMAPGDWIKLTVSDNGTGIPPEVLPHIFEPFYTTKGPGEGTGLGLAQIYGIVEQHGGRIDVATEMTQGTTFTIYLPALSAQPVEPIPAESAALWQGHGEAVLVVEDDPTLRAALVAGLEQLNYRALQAANGEYALALLAQSDREIALVLSDVVMPGMGGIALFDTLQERGYPAPLILLTGHAMDEELEALSEQGLAAWLTKPPQLERLAQEIDRVLHPAKNG